MKLAAYLTALALSILLTACGGGGSDIPVSTESPSGVVQIAAYGDSTQAFHGNPHASSRDGWTIENKGVSGSSTSEWYSRWPAEMAATKASIVIYNGGLNDGGMSVDQYKTTLREMIRITRAFGKQFILEQPNNADASGDIILPTFVERRAAVEGLAKSEGVYYCAQPDVPLRDGIHPTDAGYATKAVRLAACIEGILK